MINDSIKTEKNMNKRGDKRGLHPNSLGNLKPGNGRPKRELSITSLVREMLDEQADYIAPGATPSDKTWRQLIVRAILYHAAKGNPVIIRELLDRLEGKIVQLVGGNPDGAPIIIRVIYDGINSSST